MAKSTVAPLTMAGLKELENMPVVKPSEFIVTGQALESPFIFYAHPLSNQAWQMLTSHIQKPREQYPYLVTQDGAYELDTFTFSPIAMKQLWCIEDKVGKVIEAHETCPENPREFVEYLETVLLVYLNDKAIIARGSFKKGRVQGWKSVLSCLQEMEHDVTKWYGISQEHKLTQKITSNCLKMVVELDTKERVGKTTGLMYTYTVSRINPMSPTYFKLLTELVQSGEFSRQLTPAMSGLNRRVGELLKAK